MISEQENIRRVKEEIHRIVSCSQKSIYVMIDGDQTLIPTDSTKFFFDYLSLEFTEIKDIFKKYGYSFEAFYKVATFYSRIDQEKYDLACIESANRVSVYPEFLSFINTIKDKSEIILITSGISNSWKNVIQNHSLGFIHLIGGCYFPKDSFLIDKNAKGLAVKEIKNAGNQVFAFGDTLVDFEMLKEANNSYLVVNEKRNKDFIPFRDAIPHLEQISFSDYFHSNIPKTNFGIIEQEILSL